MRLNLDHVVTLEMLETSMDNYIQKTDALYDKLYDMEEKMDKLEEKDELTEKQEIRLRKLQDKHIIIEEEIDFMEKHMEKSQKEIEAHPDYSLPVTPKPRKKFLGIF